MCREIRLGPVTGDVLPQNGATGASAQRILKEHP
jgi:hypothetical protein